MIRRFLLLSICVTLAVVSIRAQDLDPLPHYEPGQTVSGTIRIWGNDRMRTLMDYWESGFKKYHPDVRFETNLPGTSTGMAGLYTGVADFALMGRESTAKEIQAFEWVFKYKPLGIEVATGSLAAPGKSFAVTVFVNRDNPLSRLTFAQLDGIFGSEHRRGESNIRVWGDLDLTGEWKDKVINTYGYDAETHTALFIKRIVLNGSDKWNCELKEFADLKKPNGDLLDASQQILEALRHDRYGIAYATLYYLNPQVRTIPLSSTDDSPTYEATKANLVQRKYPLARAASIYINREPGKPIDPKIREFLRYVLSQEGQQEVLREGDFLPLSEETLREQRRKLE